MPLPARAPSIPEEEEPVELARFREEWKAELQKRKAASIPSGDSEVSSIPAGPSIPTPLETSVTQILPGSSSQAASGSSVGLALNPEIDRTNLAVSRGLQGALGVYRLAVQHEQRGELDDALLLYRQAFRTDPHVDRAYHREEMLSSILAAQQISDHISDAGAPTGRVHPPVSLKPLGVDDRSTVITGTLASLLPGFPEYLNFEAEDEGTATPLCLLPDEIMLKILRKLDPTSVERFAAVSRKARVVTLDSAIWRELVHATYKPPQIPSLQTMDEVVDHYLSDYRRVYVEQPRVRLDGVYIAVCHYVRPGLSENSWVNISHLITYHRYLRFFPNGQVLSLLANEEYSPQQVIPLLKPTLRMKGLFLGTWQLAGTTVHLSNLIDASGRFPVPASVSTDPGDRYTPPTHSHSHSHSTTTTSENRARYAFVMSLNLRSRPLGRWNRLDIHSYDSVNLETGDASPVALKHERPFWFSKVRSYAG